MTQTRMTNTYKIAQHGMRIMLGILALSATLSCSLLSPKGMPTASSYQASKREFRGTWLPTIFRSEYAGLSREQARDLLSKRVTLLQRLGCNAVIFQVRAESDAWYRSSYEPWSRYLTGEQGREPEQSWDPLAFMIEECHTRGMELHAWVNPYRGASNADSKLAANHPAVKNPSWFVRYGKQLVLDPGLPQSRRYVVSVVEDIVRRYDVDAIHMDDYFYPYPVAGLTFDDEETFSRFGLTAGYRPETKDMWRRNNVDLLIYDLGETIRRIKPWVRLGISPFGIYRNQKSDPKGSRTSGLQCYDDLYADVLHWANQGWVDYIAPQVYWNIGHAVADYETLVEWWGKNIRNKRVQLYIGQDIKRTMDVHGQLDLKLLLSKAHANGNIYWPADELIRNYKGIGDELTTTYQPYRALQPEWQGALGKSKAPNMPSLVWEDLNEDGHMLMWEDAHVAADPESPFFYAVYAFPSGQKVSVKNHKALVSISTNPYYVLPAIDGRTEYTFLITAINRFWQESKPRKFKVRI